MSKYISYDAREPRIPIKDPVTGDIYIVGHADFFLLHFSKSGNSYLLPASLLRQFMRDPAAPNA